MYLTLSSVNALASNKLQSGTYCIFTPVQIPALCLSKARGANNKTSVLQVMEDKQRQVMWLPQDCAHSISVWTMNKLMLCSLAWLQWWCVKRRAAAWLCPERRLFVQAPWQRGAGERGQAGPIQQQHFPMWQQQQHTNLWNKGIKHVPLSSPCTAYTSVLQPLFHTITAIYTMHHVVHSI